MTFSLASVCVLDFRTISDQPRVGYKRCISTIALSSDVSLGSTVDDAQSMASETLPMDGVPGCYP